EGEQPHTPLQAYPQRAFPVGLPVGPKAAHPVEAERPPCLHGHGGLGPVAGMPIAQAQAQREARTAHAETQEHLLESIMAIFAVPRSRPRRDRPRAWAGRLWLRS